MSFISNSKSQNTPSWNEIQSTAILVLADGTIYHGHGCGAIGETSGELCFNTAITGYQEILTDPSYTGQIIIFTFPHIGNTGSNIEDHEQLNIATSVGAKACILKANISEPANYRNTQHFDQWLKTHGIIGICGVDTRALTLHIRKHGFINAIIAHSSTGDFNESQLIEQASQLPSLEGMELAQHATTSQDKPWSETSWIWDRGFDQQNEPKFHVVAIDYGIKRNILRLMADQGCKITVVPAATSAETILSYKPDGIFLSNGPGDPTATGAYAIPIIQKLIATDIPIFGICLGHQILALALGGNTIKMHQGHHGANHPVRDHTTQKVEITSMNHGFAVDAKTLPDSVEETHISLFDGSNCGLRVKDKPIFSIQHHPEGSPGPQDSHYLFQRFVDMMAAHKTTSHTL